MSGGPKLAELAFQQIYHRNVRHDIAGDMVVRDEYRRLVDKAPSYVIDYLTNVSANTPLILEYD